MKLFKINSNQTPLEIVTKIKEIASKFDFVIRDIFDMKEQFKSHDVTVDDTFEYYSIMVCNPQKAYASIIANPLRGAVLLPPKQIVVYKDDSGQTTIAYMKMDISSVNEILPNDGKFQEGLEQSCNQIIKLIKATNDN